MTRAAEDKMLGLAHLAADERTDEHTARNAALALAKLVAARGLPMAQSCPACAEREASADWSPSHVDIARAAAGARGVGDDDADDIDLDEVLKQINDAFGYVPGPKPRKR